MNLETVPTAPNRRRLLIGGALGLVAVTAIIVTLFSHQPNPGGSIIITVGKNDPAKTGCPSTSANVNWQKAATTFIHIDGANSIKTIHVGDIVEVALPAGYVWSLLTAENMYFQQIEPGGAYESSQNVCVWHFSTLAPGNTILYFGRHILCQPGKICSDLGIRYAFAVTITA